MTTYLYIPQCLIGARCLLLLDQAVVGNALCGTATEWKSAQIHEFYELPGSSKKCFFAQDSQAMKIEKKE